MSASTDLYSQHLGVFEMSLAVLFVGLSLVISKILKLRLEFDLLKASLRSAVQLSLVGYILGWLFQTNSLSLNLLILLFMSVVAAHAIYSRLKYKSLKLFGLALATLILSVAPSGLLTLGYVFSTQSLKTTAYFIPFMGVLMGNALSAISLAFLGLEKIKDEHWLEVENFKALGATLWEACHRIYREIFRNALTPLLNGMTVVGIVSLPGIMAGQLIGGVSPLTAARFQIFVMCLMLLASILGILVAVVLYHYTMLPNWIRNSLNHKFQSLKKGDRWFLVGPSGSGKSRLIKSYVGLDHPEVQSFHPTLPQVEIETKSKIFYVSQKPYFWTGSVEENLRYPFEFQGQKLLCYSDKKVSELLKLFGFSDEFLSRDAKKLSGGEAQVAHLIRTLILDPDILYLDEPSASLDSVRTDKFEQWLLIWSQNHALVMISHNQDQIERCATAVLEIRNPSSSVAS